MKQDRSKTSLIRRLFPSKAAKPEPLRPLIAETISVAIHLHGADEPVLKELILEDRTTLVGRDVYLVARHDSDEAFYSYIRKIQKYGVSVKQSDGSETVHLSNVISSVTRSKPLIHQLQPNKLDGLCRRWQLQAQKTPGSATSLRIRDLEADHLETLLATLQELNATP